MLLGMLSTGERTGNVDAMMDKAAEYLESEAEHRAHRYAAIFSVVVYLIVAFLVAASVVSFYMGYTSMAGLDSAGN